MSIEPNRYAEKQISELADKIKAVYRQAQAEVRRKYDAFLAQHKAADERMREKLKQGKMTPADYKNWQRSQVFQGRRWSQRLADITRVYVGADEKARQLIEGVRENIFVNSANYTAEDMDRHMRGGISFTMYSRNTIGRLLKDAPQMLPKYKIDEPKDYIWNEKRVRNAVIQGIIQGESVGMIGKRLTTELAASNASKMLMFARTAVTGAQNAGTIERMHEAQDMGISVKKKWESVGDDRVRDAHKELDGTIIDVDSPFEVDGMTIDYPGDPNAPPELTYNCRCTLTYIYPKYK